MPSCESLCCTCLELLQLSFSSITSDALRILGGGCPGLRSLDLACTSLNYPGDHDDGAAFAELCAGCPLLEQLNLCSVSITTDACVEAISRLPLLRVLELGSSELSDTGLTHLAHGCGRLQHLSLFHCEHISLQGLVGIAKACSNLVSLEIEECPLLVAESERVNETLTTLLPALGDCFDTNYCREDWISNFVLDQAPIRSIIREAALAEDEQNGEDSGEDDDDEDNVQLRHLPRKRRRLVSDSDDDMSD